TTCDRRRDRLTQQSAQPLSRRNAVAALRPVLSRSDGEHRAGKPLGKSGQYPSTLNIAQRRRCGDIEAELNPRVGGVHALAARARSMGELLDQVSCGYAQSVRRTRPWWHVQIVHL